VVLRAQLAATMGRMKLYDSGISGNAYKARLALSWLARDYERIEVDILAGNASKPDYRAKDPASTVPILELEDGSRIWESGAILCFLADGSEFYPHDRLERARIHQWMFFEQNRHEPHVAGARAINRFDNSRLHELPARQQAGRRALEVMEAGLSHSPFFAGDQPTIADIALYAYTHVADEGGIALDDFPRVRTWLDRVAAQPAHVEMHDLKPASNQR
jgi:glutathione S-transferase